MGDDPPTAAAPTELGHVPEGTEAITAWSLDYGDDLPQQRSWRPVILALTGALVAVAVAGGFAVWQLRGDESVALPTSSPAPTPLPRPGWGIDLPRPTTTPPVVTVTAPPATVTAAPPPLTPVQMRPPPDVAAEEMAGWDRDLVANLQARGWSVWDPQLAAQHARAVCAALDQGDSAQFVTQRLSSTYPNPHEARTFVDVVMMTYPDCP